MGEKLRPKRDPEENEARQAARAAKREQARDARTIAIVSGLIEIERAVRKLEAIDDSGLLSLATLRLLDAKRAAR